MLAHHGIGAARRLRQRARQIAFEEVVARVVGAPGAVCRGASGDGAIYALETRNGALFWKYQTEGKVESDPVLAGDRLFVTATDSLLYAFRIVKTVKQ